MKLKVAWLLILHVAIHELTAAQGDKNGGITGTATGGPKLRGVEGNATGSERGPSVTGYATTVEDSERLMYEHSRSSGITGAEGTATGSEVGGSMYEHPKSSGITGAARPVAGSEVRGSMYEHVRSEEIMEAEGAATGSDMKDSKDSQTIGILLGFGVIASAPAEKEVTPKERKKRRKSKIEWRGNNKGSDKRSQVPTKRKHEDYMSCQASKRLEISSKLKCVAW